jgi:PIN domain nuclease of toxin-antitoxin system
VIAATRRVLLDTNAVIWLAAGPDGLGRRARDLLLDARDRQALFLSVVTLWELAVLAQKGRLRLEGDLARWSHDAEAVGYAFLSVDALVVLEACRLPGFHADPADRFLVATARLNGLTLITGDRAVLAWPGALDRHDARV